MSELSSEHERKTLTFIKIMLDCYKFAYSIVRD